MPEELPSFGKSEKRNPEIEHLKAIFSRFMESVLKG